MSGVPLAAQPAPACCQGLWEQITWAGAASTYGCSHRSRDCPPCSLRDGTHAKMVAALGTCLGVYFSFQEH